nr:cell wall mannoprotein PIR3 [Aedes albopictus]
MLKIVILSVAVAAVAGSSAVKVEEPSAKNTVKRGLDSLNFGFGGHNAVGADFWPGASRLGGAAPWIQNSGWKHGPSPAEIAATIAAAKQASAQVLIAQQQVQAAKDNVLNQQKVANEKEASAAYASQKSEATAAVQRSEAAAAAQAVVLAQHRLAAAKANVAHHQRIAAAKESLAAQAIQSSAKAAAAEIHRAEIEAAKLAAHHRSDAASLNHHVIAIKDESFAPLTFGGNQIPTTQLYRALASPWNDLGSVSAQNPWANGFSVGSQGKPIWG